MKRVLVTGADGFMGRRLCERLSLEHMEVIQHSISDGDISEQPLPDENIDWVFHLAALTNVPESWEKPSLYYRVNVMGTEHVLELCRRNACGLTFISTYVYGHPQYSPIDEEHPVSPNSPYNHSKFLGEELCRFFNRVFNIPIVIFRPFNIFGPGQSPHFLIPEIMKQLLDNESKEIRLLDLEPKRDYVYIDDVIEALIKSIGGQGFEIYNLGSGKLASVLEVVNAAMEVSGIRKSILSEGKSRKNEVSDMVASIEKACIHLGWSPQVSLKEGLSNMMMDLDARKIST
jgi:nucleoside-diphosphate-sugar epimerase